MQSSGCVRLTKQIIQYINLSKALVTSAIQVYEFQVFISFLVICRVGIAMNHILSNLVYGTSGNAIEAVVICMMLITGIKI